ncbi:maleylacetate reductase [Pseudonocardia thermophila]|uniref:Maleylacetate reductase n=1 Tax=Pseudonocardia thermophila TaxID=1848 RepID=A0A1M6YIC3_PSETH|nr:maleylacetate reductase [Pseudonocardia thermophila]SHL17845.1 maleylacetate reductase [Pseudonocardia thermophila]
MEPFIYDALPSRVVFGAGAARTRLAAEVDRLGAKAVLLVGSDRYAALAEPFAGRVHGRFTEVREHVPVGTAEAARAAARGADAVVAIGGGSAIGAAKAVALTEGLPIVAVPTTYAGSEMTPIWGLTEGGRKITGTDPVVLPKVVVYDPELVASLPRDLAVASGLNAMAHAVDGMWAPGRNPISAVLAEDGIRALAAGLRTVDPEELLRGAWLGAAAFAVTGSGLHHKLAHVLGGMGMPHARTHAVLLPHVLAFNAPGAPEAAERIARALGADDAVAGLRALADELGVPRGLRELGLAEDRLAEAAQLAAPAVPKDNPVPVDETGLRELLRRAWAG